MSILKKAFGIPEMPYDADVRYGLGDGMTWVALLAPRPETSIAVVYPNEDVKRNLTPRYSDPEFHNGKTIWDFMPDGLDPFPDKGVFHDLDYIYFANNTCIYFYGLDSVPIPDGDEEGSDFDAIWWAGCKDSFKTRMRMYDIVKKLQSRGQYPLLSFVT